VSIPAYAEYEASLAPTGLPRPSHWKVSPLKRLFTIVGGSTPDSSKRELWDGDIPWATPADLGNDCCFDLTSTSRQITPLGLASCGTKMVPAGTILLATRAPIGTVGIAAMPLCTNQGCKSLVPKSGINSRYYAYVLSASTEALTTRGKGTTFLELSGDELGLFHVPVPPPPEQLAIATFLDRETAKIDALVSEHRKLSLLAAEKRQAIVSHAVSGGLAPGARMKPSGVKWLGEVPEHWEEFPLRALFGLKHGYPFDSSRFEESGDFIVMTPGNFWERGGFRKKAQEKFYRGSDFPPEYILKAGQMLVAMTEQAPGLLGSALCVPDTGTYLHNQRLGLVQDLRTDRVCERYLFHLFNSSRYRAEIGCNVSGSTVRHTSPSKIRSVKVYLPPFEEQTRIAHYIDQRLAVLDEMATEAEHTTALLQERRAASIAAAVTGQIDVRGLVAA